MKYKIILLFILTVFSTQYTYSQSTVYVEATEFGRGILKMRGSETFIISPAHVVEMDEENWTPITIFGAGNKQQGAIHEKSFAGDLAILRFESESILNADKWQLHKNYSNLINSISEAYLELREPDGSVTIEEVSIKGRDIQYIQIKPKDPKFKLGQGNSGSSLFAQHQGEKVFLGMLQSIEDDETGSVIRADEMDKLLSSFFDPGKKEKKSKVISDQNLTREAQDLKFNLLNINKSGKRVAFTFDVTSLNTSKLLKIHYGNIKLYVDDGSQYGTKSITIGNKTSHIMEYNLIKDVEVPMTIVFNEISSSASLATLFELGFTVDNKNGSISYKDIYLGDDTEALDGEGSWSYETLGFRFEFENVFKNGSEVLFNFNVTSLNEEKPIDLNWSKIAFYDDRGFEYKAKKITIGNKSSHIVNYRLIKDIQVPLSILFTEVSQAAKNVSQIKVEFYTGRNSSIFQLGNLEFAQKQVEKTQLASSNTASTSNNSPMKCGEVYFYRKLGMLECPEPVYLYNYDELIAKLQPGIRYKALVCEDRPFKLSVRTNPNEVALFSSSPDIELGKKYYFKINCSMGVSAISLMEDKKGAQDLKNNKKFKRSLAEIRLKKY